MAGDEYRELRKTSNDLVAGMSRERHHACGTPLLEGSTTVIQAKCERCGQAISPEDSIQVSGNGVSHADCHRPRGLTHEERGLLFTYCFDHDVACCPACARSFRQSELGADLLGNRMYLCRSCRRDLTPTIRTHLYACATIPETSRLKARQARDAALERLEEPRLVSSLAAVLERLGG